MLHIVDSERMIKFCQGDEVVFLPSSLLPYGRLFRDFSEEEIFRYVDDVARKFGRLNPYRFATYLLSLLNYNFSKYDKIIVWHTDSISGQLFFFLLCKIITYPIYEILYDRQFSYGSDRIEYFRKKIIRIDPISSENQEKNAKIWDDCCSSEKDLRIIRDNTITQLEINFFDDIILRKAFPGKLRYYELIESVRDTSLLKYSFGDDDNAFEFVDNRTIELAKIGKLQPFILEKGHWRKFNYNEYFYRKDLAKIKLKLSPDVTVPVAKKTLYLFPESVSDIIVAKLNGNDSIVSFPSFVLPFCRLPRGLGWDEWKQYGNDIQKLLRISTPDIEERFELFFKTNFYDYDRIVVVHTDSVPELLFMYMVNSLIKTDLYELNLSNCSKYGTIGSIGEVAPIYFDQLFLPEKPVKILVDKRTEMELIWDQIIDNSNELRVRDSDGKIVDVGFEYLDNNMMDYCNPKYKNLNIQSFEFVSTEPFGLNFGSLNRFTFVRMIELAKRGKVFPYNAKTKEELSVESLEPIDTLDSRKILLLRNKIPQTPSLFD